MGRRLPTVVCKNVQIPIQKKHAQSNVGTKSGWSIPAKEANPAAHINGVKSTRVICNANRTAFHHGFGTSSIPYAVLQKPAVLDYT